VGDDRHILFRQKLLGENGSVRQGVVMVQQPDLFSPKFGAKSSHVFMQSPQNFATEPEIHSLPFSKNSLCYHSFCTQFGKFLILHRKVFFFLLV
jgi:hypothetical protein